MYHFLALTAFQAQAKDLTFPYNHANTDTLCIRGLVFVKKLTTLDVRKTGENLKRAIQDSGYTVRELQELLHMECPQGIYRWMQGKTLPSLDNLYILCRLLGVAIEDVLVEQKADF